MNRILIFLTVILICVEAVATNRSTRGETFVVASLGLIALGAAGGWRFRR